MTDENGATATGRLADKVIVVTAAAQGIGRAVAERLIADGAVVHASDINGAGMDGLDAESTTVLDATDGAAVAEYFTRFDRLDGVVQAVGYVHHGNIEECSDADWRRSMSITLDSAFYVMGAAVPKMKAEGGSIVTIGSICGSIKGFAKRAAYGASKGGIIGLTKSVAVDYLNDGIRCNSVCPGTVDSPSMRGRIAELAEKTGDAEAAYRFFIDRQPSGRFGKPEEIAAMCAFLLSDDGAFITGQAINVDGGITI